MTQEEKLLLLKDLSARLPYGVKIAIEYSESKYTHVYDLREIDNDATSELRQQITIWDYGFYSSVISYPLINCRPYLRPMSSMTEEEFNELHKLCPHSVFNATNVPGWIVGINGSDYGRIARVNEISNLIDYLNKHHFDYRGLIEKGLAIEVTEENNPYNLDLL